jgi:hypothetical protein
MYIEGTSGGNNPLIKFDYALFSWVKNVETYNSPNCNDCSHIILTYSHGCEIRDSYVHHGFDSSGGRNYGITIFQWNSDHKIENNIGEANRHSFIMEGGGSGSAILYNYFDDNWENQVSNSYEFITGDFGNNHGAHPYMNLYEGNYASKFRADYTHGSSSHGVVFRNYFRGERSDVLTPGASTWGYWAVDTQYRNNYYSFIGNILGSPSWTTGTVTASTTCSSQGLSVKTAFRFGCDGNPGNYQNSDSLTTAIRHGNYDYITDGVANWDGGADHTIPESLYYVTKPAWYGGCVWPPINPVAPTVSYIPAKLRYENSNCGYTPSMGHKKGKASGFKGGFQ